MNSMMSCMTRSCTLEEVQNATKLLEESVGLFCQGEVGGGAGVGAGAGVGMFFFFFPHKMDLVTDGFFWVRRW